jgi:hypothetical protein
MAWLWLYSAPYSVQEETAIGSEILYTQIYHKKNMIHFKRGHIKKLLRADYAVV